MAPSPLQTAHGGLTAMTFERVLFYVLATLILLPATVGAQTVEKATLSHGTSSGLPLDTLVNDPFGNVVLDLGATDLAGGAGRPIDVNGISFYSSRFSKGGARTAERPGKARADRHFVFVFHDPEDSANTHASGASRSEVIGQSLRWIREEMGENDWVAITRVGAKVEMLQGFTQDRAALRLVLDAIH